MPTCPECRRSFRTLDDEEGMHGCPRCGYGEAIDDDFSDCDDYIGEVEEREEYE